MNVIEAVVLCQCVHSYLYASLLAQLLPPTQSAAAQEKLSTEVDALKQQMASITREKEEENERVAKSVEDKVCGVGTTVTSTGLYLPAWGLLNCSCYIIMLTYACKCVNGNVIIRLVTALICHNSTVAVGFV